MLQDSQLRLFSCHMTRFSKFSTSLSGPSVAKLWMVRKSTAVCHLATSVYLLKMGMFNGCISLSVFFFSRVFVWRWRLSVSRIVRDTGKLSFVPRVEGLWRCHPIYSSHVNMCFEWIWAGNWLYYSVESERG